jgi:hypothetical protein
VKRAPEEQPVRCARRALRPRTRADTQRSASRATLLTRAERRQAVPTLGEQACTDEESMRIAIGQHLPKGQRPPKRLTAMQMVRVRAAGCGGGTRIR